MLLLIQVSMLSQRNGIDELQQRTQADMNRYALSLQQTLDRYKDLPRLLSTHSELINTLLYDKSSDSRMRANLYLEQVNSVIGASDTYLMNSEGVTIAASNWTKSSSFVDRNFSFRPYFQDAVKGQPGRYFALGTTSNKRGYFFAYPVKHRGTIYGAVVVKIDLNEIEEDWSDPDTDLLVTDEDGVIFISTQPEWKFHTLRPLSQADVKRIINSLRYGNHQLTSLDVIKREQRADGSQLITLVDGPEIRNSALDGARAGEYLLQNTQVPEAGFKVAILASLKPVKRQAFNAMIFAAFIYIAIVLLVLVLTIRRRIMKERSQFRSRELKTLEKNESRIRAIIDNTQAGLITLDSQGRIETFNHTAERLFGYREDQLKNRFFSLLLAHADRPVCWQHITNNANVFGNDLNIEASGRRQNGSFFPVELSIGQMPGEAGSRFLITMHDITERKQYEEALQQAQAELENRVRDRTLDLTKANQKLRDEMQQHKETQNELIQTAKLAVLGQMSAGINHELNQPLTAIRAYADNAQQFLRLSRIDNVERNLQEISQLTERMAKIIHPLKEFSRKSSGQQESVCLQSVRDGAMAIMYGRLGREDVVISWPEGLDRYYVLGDIVRIEQVLVNLIGNAIQAMDQQAERRIDIRLDYEEHCHVLYVHDAGPGIPEADLERVFEPFFTTKKAGSGLGLGLSISHRIIASMGGELSVSNHPAGGAQFRLALPADPSMDLNQQLTTL
ncbi:ATP-binding protein [Neptunomonas phycophila]|uniref:ATP-binding protein n=1 Tax=Neptunomonas phycophila TaxID=1572645 RepID=UPI000A487945|nr:ATP-binding protein [Neptunomonas phycophila]MDO6468440.1 ATP-binding protein [Neptunomonas phycophila]MDO6784889.1 ATP-binding protein [Neptunomonas phycophila]